MRALAVAALLFPCLAACREEPPPPVRPVESGLETFLDMNIRLSAEAQAGARQTLEGFFARKAAPSRIEYAVLAGALNKAGDWPLLLFVCVRDIPRPPEEALSHVVVLTSQIGGRFFGVGDLVGNSRFTDPAALDASYPPALRSRVQACLNVRGTPGGSGAP